MFEKIYTSFVSSDGCLNVCFVIAVIIIIIMKGWWNLKHCVGTTIKGSNGSCLASLPVVHLLFYIPMALLLILCTSCIYFHVI